MVEAGYNNGSSTTILAFRIVKLNFLFCEGSISKKTLCSLRLLSALCGKTKIKYSSATPLRTLR